MIITRFAPSPTGLLHLGSARTALFNYLFAKANQGIFKLRIEDTDTERSYKEAEYDILEGLKWLGLNYTEPIIYQSQRHNRYQEVIQQLIEKKLAYRCYCPKAKSNSQYIPTEVTCNCRNLLDKLEQMHTVRIRFPRVGTIETYDLVQSKICWQNSNFEDFVIARSDGKVTYMLAAVVDDHDMQITHIIRGDDHLINTPKQLYLYQCLQWKPPQFAHIPLILSMDGSKLSKRKGDTSINAYYAQGFLPEAVNNLMLRLGWSYNNQEIISMTEAIQHFSLTHINRHSAKFNPNKLKSLNKLYLKRIDNTSLLKSIIEHYAQKLNQPLLPHEIERTNQIIDSVKIRCSTLHEVYKMVAFIQDQDTFKILPELTPTINSSLLEEIHNQLEQIPIWNTNNLSKALEAIPTDLKSIALQLRIALTNSSTSIGIYDIMTCLGSNSVLFRIQNAKRANQESTYQKQ